MATETTESFLNCLSTHGGSGYSYGDYWDEDGNIICGGCGYIIENPHSTGGYQEFAPGWRGWLLGRSRSVPDWGFMGQHPVALQKYWERYPERAEYKSRKGRI